MFESSWFHCVRNLPESTLLYKMFINSSRSISDFILDILPKVVAFSEDFWIWMFTKSSFQYEDKPGKPYSHGSRSLSRPYIFFSPFNKSTLRCWKSWDSFRLCDSRSIEFLAVFLISNVNTAKVISLRYTLHGQVFHKLVYLNSNIHLYC